MKARNRIEVSFEDYALEGDALEDIHLARHSNSAVHQTCGEKHLERLFLTLGHFLGLYTILHLVREELVWEIKYMFS